MFDDQIIGKLSKIKYKLESQLVYITPNVSYWMYSVINRARKNYVGQFDNPYFPSGQEKMWFPLTETTVKTIRKELKLEMKDFNFVPLRPDSFGAVRLLHYATLAELRRARFDELLKRIKEVFTIDGSAVIKFSSHYVKSLKRRVMNLEIKDWFNMLFDHTASSLDESPVFERIILDMDEAKQMKGWRNVEAGASVDPRKLSPSATLAVPTYYQSGEPVFTGWYCWLPIPKAWIKQWNDEKYEPTQEDLNTYTEGVVVVSKLGETQKDEKGNDIGWETKIHYIAESPYKNREDKAIKPYKLINYEHLPGRLPGRGPAEALFDLQLYINAVVNIRYIGQQLRNTVMMFFNPQRTGLRPGDLERLGPTGMVPMNSVDDSAIKFPSIPAAPDTYNEQNAILDASQKLTSATDTAQASDAASKSATGNVLDSQYTQSSFQDIKESIAHDFVDLFEDLIIPFVLDNLSNDEILAVSGDPKDLEDFDEKNIKHHVATQALDFIERTGKVPTREETAAQEEKLRKHFRGMGTSRYIKLNKDVVDELKKNRDYHFEVAISEDILPVETIVNELKQTIQMIPPQNMANLNLDANKVMAIIFDRLGYRYEALQMATPPQQQAAAAPQMPNPLTQGNSVAPQTNALTKTGVNPVARAIK